MLSSCFEMGHNVTDANAKSLLNMHNGFEQRLLKNQATKSSVW